MTSYLHKNDGCTVEELQKALHKLVLEGYGDLKVKERRGEPIRYLDLEKSCVIIGEAY